MAAKAAILRWPGNVVAVVPVTIQTIPNVAGLTVFLVKVRVGLPEGMFDEPPLTYPGSHHLIKQGIVTLMTANTAAGSIVTG